MADREEFLSALSEETAFNFQRVMQRHYAASDLFDINEIIETLSKNQLSSVWNNLLRFCTNALQESFSEDESQQQEGMQEALQTLQDLTTIALGFVSLEKPTITPDVLQIANVLHGILLTLPEEASKLQNDISKLCEYWFQSEFSGKEELISNTVIYLLARTHLQAPTKIDLKRVWDMRQAFELFDLDDESSDGLKELMQRCLMHPLYLGTEMGKKILVFMFTLHSSVIGDFHRNIKNQIPSCQVMFLDAFGEIYFKAWKEATDSFKERLENDCIQGLMYCAIHGKKLVFSKVYNILTYFHKQKNQPGVDEMLYKLYQPILWRALKASNPLVRANAATILVDAFPLQDPSAGLVQNDELKQMQLDTIAELLQDGYPAVRSIAIQGVCRISFTYWEFIPPAIIRAYLTKMTEDLAFDASSSEVRLAVFKGLKFLINNRLSHTLLKSLMPNLQDLIHDTSEKVRRTFLELLLLVKGVRSIQFWSVVPTEHLLARLEVETSTKCIKMIVKLLINSYLPPKGDPASQIANCTELMSQSRAAARKFFKYAHYSASVRVIANFIFLICECVLECTRNPAKSKRHEPEAINEGEARQNTSRDEGFSEDEEPPNKESSDEEKHWEIDFSDEKLMAAMLDVLVISWLSIKLKFAKGGNASLNEKLVKVLSGAVPELLQGFEDPEAKSAVIVLAANLPPTSTSMISESCLDALHKLPADTASNEFGPLVQYLCSSGFVVDVLDHVHQCISKGLNQYGSTQKKNSRKKDKGAQKDNRSYKLAVDMLSWMLVQPTTRDAILEHTERCGKLCDILKSSMNSLEKLVETSKTQQSSDDIARETGDFFAHCLSLNCRLRIHMQGKREGIFDEGVNIIEEVEGIFAWMDRILLPEIDNYCGTSLDSAASNLVEGTKSKKRTKDSSDASNINFGAYILRLLKDQLIVSSEIILLGMGSPQFYDNVADFIHLLSTHVPAIYILPEMMRIAFDLTQVRILNREQDTIGAFPVLNIVKACFKLIKLADDNNSEHDSTQVLSAIKRHFTEIVKSRYYSQAAAAPSDVSIMNTILSIIVDDVANFLEEDEGIARFESINDMPAISSFIFNVLTKSKQLQRSLFEEIFYHVEGETLSDKWKLSAMTFIIDVIMRSGGGNDRNELLLKSILELQKRMKEFQSADNNANLTTSIETLPAATITLLSEMTKKTVENDQSE